MEVRINSKLNRIVKKICTFLKILGRVTDDYDKRLLKTYVKCWFRDDMFEPTFQFEDKTYRIPKMTRIDDILEYIQSS